MLDLEAVRAANRQDFDAALACTDLAALRMLTATISGRVHGVLSETETMQLTLDKVQQAWKAASLRALESYADGWSNAGSYLDGSAAAAETEAELRTIQRLASGCHSQAKVLYDKLK